MEDNDDQEFWNSKVWMLFITQKVRTVRRTFAYNKPFENELRRKSEKNEHKTMILVMIIFQKKKKKQIAVKITVLMIIVVVVVVVKTQLMVQVTDGRFARSR